MLIPVEFGEEVAEGDADGCAGDFEDGVGGFLKAGGGADVGLAEFGVDDPDVFGAKAEIVVDALTDSGHGVFRRENFDKQQGRGAEDAFPFETGGRDGDVRPAKAGGGDLNSSLGKDFDLPGLPVLHEEVGERGLQDCVFFFTRVALQDFAVHIVAVRAVAGGEVLAEGDSDGMRDGAHGSSMPPCMAGGCRKMVGEAGIEPATPSLEGWCSIQLSYSPLQGHSSPVGLCGHWEWTWRCTAIGPRVRY